MFEKYVFFLILKTSIEFVNNVWIFQYIYGQLIHMIKSESNSFSQLYYVNQIKTTFNN